MTTLFVGKREDSRKLGLVLHDMEDVCLCIENVLEKIGLATYHGQFRETNTLLTYTCRNGGELNFHVAMQVIVDLAFLLLKSRTEGGVNLRLLNPSLPRKIITLSIDTPTQAMLLKALADFVKHREAYDLHHWLTDEELRDMALEVDQMVRIPLKKALSMTSTPASVAPPQPLSAKDARQREAFLLKQQQLLAQCQAWHDEGEFQKIIHKLESLEDRTPELDSELARAYNNLADHTTKKGRRLLRQALNLLLPHAAYFKDNFLWNFRVGYSYYYLDEEHHALPYFEVALEQSPDDEDTKFLYHSSLERLACPFFRKPFKARVKKTWDRFLKEEASLRDLLESCQASHDDPDLVHALLTQTRRLLSPLFPVCSFDIDIAKDGKYQLAIFCEQEKSRLFEVNAFLAQAPESLKALWHFEAGHPITQDVRFVSPDGWTIDHRDVTVWVTPSHGDMFSIELYSPKLARYYDTHPDEAQFVSMVLVDMAIGEVTNMRYITSISLTETPLASPGITLLELPTALRHEGCTVPLSSHEYLQHLVHFDWKGQVDIEDVRKHRPGIRLDIETIASRCALVVNMALESDDSIFNRLFDDGVVAGYLAYEVNDLKQKGKLEHFEAQLKALFAEYPLDATLFGEAQGIDCHYLDFFAWDLKSFLNKVNRFVQTSDVSFLQFRTFQDGGKAWIPGVTLKEAPALTVAMLDEKLKPGDWTPYSHDLHDAFMKQLDAWNDENQFLRCVQAINTIPEKARSLDIKIALARELENVAIVGDPALTCERDVGEVALLKAIKVLESIKDECTYNPTWFQRMAYAYQYLDGQEAIALPYAKRWAELAPHDAVAPQLVSQLEAATKTHQAQEKTTKEANEPQGVPRPSRTQIYDLPRYSSQEFSAIRHHIEHYFGTTSYVIHEADNPDRPIDVVVIEPNQERDYYTLITLGMGTFNMPVPEEMKAYDLERAELIIALASDWKLDPKALEDERWYWPIRLLRYLARFCLEREDAWIGWGHTFNIDDGFAPNTQLSGAVIVNPGFAEPDASVCKLPHGGDLNFYLVLPLYEEEVQYKVEHGMKALLEKLDGLSYVVNPQRHNLLRLEHAGALNSKPFEDLMLDAKWHIDAVEDKTLTLPDPMAFYSAPSLYLRWGIEQNLMSEEFCRQHADFIKQVKTNPSSIDVRAYLRDELQGQLWTHFFNEEGQQFAGYYFNQNTTPHFLRDIDLYAVDFVGVERNYSDDIQDEAYLFVPFNEAYYEAMRTTLDKRYANWKNQAYDKATMTPSSLAQAFMKFLNCECLYFPSMRDDDPITNAYWHRLISAEHDGFVPVIIRADDEILWECLLMNADPESQGKPYDQFDMEQVKAFRKAMLSETLPEGRNILDEWVTHPRTGSTMLDQKVRSLETPHQFRGYWNVETDMTYPVILAMIPVKKPWEVFAYLPFGNWNQCPDTVRLMSIARYWYAHHKALPALITHASLEFTLAHPVSHDESTAVALDHMALAPNILGVHDGVNTMKRYAAYLEKATMWYFWWD